MSSHRFFFLQVRYDERGSREEEWLNLGRSRFSWVTEPAAGCPSNPTVVQGLTPAGKDAVDHKVLLVCIILRHLQLIKAGVLQAF